MLKPRTSLATLSSDPPPKRPPSTDPREPLLLVSFVFPDTIVVHRPLPPKELILC